MADDVYDVSWATGEQAKPEEKKTEKPQAHPYEEAVGQALDSIPILGDVSKYVKKQAQEIKHSPGQAAASAAFGAPEGVAKLADVPINVVASLVHEAVKNGVAQGLQGMSPEARQRGAGMQKEIEQNRPQGANLAQQYMNIPGMNTIQQSNPASFGAGAMVGPLAVPIGGGISLPGAAAQALGRVPMIGSILPQVAGAAASGVPLGAAMGISDAYQQGQPMMQGAAQGAGNLALAAAVTSALLHGAGGGLKGLTASKQGGKGTVPAGEKRGFGAKGVVQPPVQAATPPQPAQGPPVAPTQSVPGAQPALVPQGAQPAWAQNVQTGVFRRTRNEPPAKTTGDLKASGESTPSAGSALKSQPEQTSNAHTPSGETLTPKRGPAKAGGSVKKPTPAVAVNSTPGQPVMGKKATEAKRPMSDNGAQAQELQQKQSAGESTSKKKEQGAPEQTPQLEGKVESTREETGTQASPRTDMRADRLERRRQALVEPSKELKETLSPLAQAVRERDKARSRMMSAWKQFADESKVDLKNDVELPDEVRQAIAQEFGGELEGSKPSMSAMSVVSSGVPHDFGKDFGDLPKMAQQARSLYYKWQEAEDELKFQKESSGAESQFFKEVPAGHSVEVSGINFSHEAKQGGRYKFESPNDEQGYNEALDAARKQFPERATTSEYQMKHLQGQLTELADEIEGVYGKEDAAPYREAVRQLGISKNKFLAQGITYGVPIPGLPQVLSVLEGAWNYAKGGKLGLVLMHAAQTQTNHDIYMQHDPILGQVMLNLRGQLDQLSFGNDLAANPAESELFAKARHMSDKDIKEGLEGLGALPEKTRDYLVQRNGVLDEAADILKAVDQSLEEQGVSIDSPLSDMAGLGRFRRVIQQDLEAITGQANKSRTDKTLGFVTGNIYKSYISGNPEVHELHAIEALAHNVAGAPRAFVEGLRLLATKEGREFAGGFKASGALRRVLDESPPAQWFAKAEEKVLGKIYDAASKIPGAPQVASVLEGTGIENVKVAVTRMTALAKASREMDMAPEELMRGLMDGSLGAEKALEAHVRMMDYMGDAIGYSPAGYTNKTVFQRNKVMGLMAPWMTTRTMQARLLQRFLLNSARKIGDKDILGATSEFRKAAVLLGVISLFSGQHAKPKELDRALSWANPTLNHELNDKLKYAEMVGFALQSEVGHIQPAIVPLLFAGENMPQSMWDQMKGLAEHKDGWQATRGLAMIGALAGVSSLFRGTMGTQAAIKLGKAVNDGVRGEHTDYAYSNAKFTWEEERRAMGSRDRKTNLLETLKDWAIAGENKGAAEWANNVRDQQSAKEALKDKAPALYKFTQKFYASEKRSMGLGKLNKALKQAGKPEIEGPGPDWLKMLKGLPAPKKEESLSASET